MMRNKIILAVVLLLSALTSVQAEDNPNARQARRIFNQAYQQVFGEQGATLRYDVNIIGIYKTYGTIWYKGKKSKFVDAKMNSWNDGETVYTIKKKKKEVEIHSAKNNKSDKYSSKFKFEPDNYTYSIDNDPEGYIITVKAKKGVDGVKEARVTLDRQTRDPKFVRIKVAFLWAKIYITNFKSGNISDDVFVFPRNKYSDFKFVDKRKDD